MARRIVLLSDGTGNSSANVWRTNVWRMFSALDLTHDDQIACYDNGVGTSSFKPLALMGGAFGIGLRRNVVTLYKFACRNYRNPDDEIFAFGFSRGAFTIRVTVGLILDQGLVPGSGMAESDLDREARKAYREYHKRHFHTNWYLILQNLMKLFGRTVRPPGGMPSGRTLPIIRFLGLWDTVAAYGLPIDELTLGVSQWIWPLELPNHTLHPSVKRACHALALDDERTTFHPVLWNERSEPAPPPGPRYTFSDRLTQVWFAGVHANVGGGYPDDSLSHIPLYWIMEEARACGLCFKTANPAAMDETKQAQDKDGCLYDSRAGIGGYYRYGPRRISRLARQTFSWTTGDEVYVQKPKIHQTVLRRIQNNAHVYGPIGIPHDYDVVSPVVAPDGCLHFRIDGLPATQAEVTPNTPETATQAQARVIAERERIWPLVHLRALLYFSTLLATLVFVIFPLAGRGDPLGERTNALKWLSDFIRTLGGFLPSWASQWFVSYAQYPITFVVLVALIGGLLWGSSRIAAAIQDRMASLWSRAFAGTLPAPGKPPSSTPAGGDRLLVGIRTGWRYYLAPALSAILIAYLVLSVGNRFLFTAVDQAGLYCNPTDRPRLIPENGVLVSFKPSNLCFATGYKVARLARYLVWTNPEPAVLANAYKGFAVDKDTCNAATPPKNPTLTTGAVQTDARGYSTFSNPSDAAQLSWSDTIWHTLLTPLRRYYFQPWFQPIARYGSLGSEVDFLEPDPDRRVKAISEHATPKVSDELFFYVNDAVLVLPRSWQRFYNDNSGCLSFFIKPVNRLP
ncbi:DUF2235 domain-containing protein [Bradyrhizobium sp. NBAIM20]|uniref:DUF2235 domain-containing protein n=1 Tax=unclassified Bradyrhizobium TaxID=2631580 RepID=UPI001CD28598|nr:MULTISPECIES: DUF2235 domain-containing protein [unclassified Bradyrhizobium]MCA1416323.1 DUF2235 domain-containing protein [Bradyrhizobium sp. NBAIM20]MCA1466101.1 DUF2235 domain-containing protein [Bradyrhizobium sp. NBAIM18]